jgi:hypothetical protein
LLTTEEGWPGGYDDLFAISIFTKAQWEKLSKEEDVMITGFIIGQNKEYIANASYSQVAPAADLKDITGLRENILSTFKFISR